MLFQFPIMSYPYSKAQFQGFPGRSVVGGKKKNKNTCQCRRFGFDSWVRKIPWRRKWKPTPVFLPGKSEGQKSLVGYCPWGPKKVGHNLATQTTTKLNSTTKIFQRSSLFSTVFNLLWAGSHSPLLGVFCCFVFFFYGTSYISAKLVLMPLLNFLLT